MPKGLQKTLSKALQPNIADRCLDIVDFISDLSAYLHSPQFANEKKIGDQAGEIFEKFQTLQQKLISLEKTSISNIELGFILHRSLGFNALYAEFKESSSCLLFGEGAISGVEAIMSLLLYERHSRCSIISTSRT